LRILHFTDLHSHYQFLYKIIDRVQPDIIIFSGDITHFGSQTDIEELWQELEHFSNIKMYAVLGNCDPSSTIINAFKGTRINYIGFKIEAFDENGVIVGIDGGLKSIFATVNEYWEEDYDKFVEKIQLSEIWKNSKFKIVVSHNPPYGLLDKVQSGHKGSRALLKLTQQANLYLCGHIHEQKDYKVIPNGFIINPGPYRTHHYCIIDYQNPQEIRIELKNFYLKDRKNG